MLNLESAIGWLVLDKGIASCSGSETIAVGWCDVGKWQTTASRPGRVEANVAQRLVHDHVAVPALETMDNDWGNTVLLTVETLMTQA